MTVRWCFLFFSVVLGTGCSSIRTADKPTCAACRQPVTEAPIEVGGAVYHRHHFTCAYCGEQFEGLRYASDGEKYYHQSCYEKHVILCAYCAAPIGDDKAVAYEGEKYHQSCFSTHIVSCAICGERIKDDTYRSSNEKYYHNSCYMEFMVPRCDFCGNPIRDETYTLTGGKKYHKSCYDDFVVLRCTLCGETIRGDYITNFWGDKYHASHRGNAPSCDFCRRFLRTPLEKGSVEYEDGRYLCGSCGASSVQTVKEVEEVASLVSDQLHEIDIEVDTDALSFRVVGAVEMRHLNRYSPHKLAGLTTCSEVVGVPGRTDYDHVQVYILKGMPRVQLISAIAHELMHVWQLIHCRLKINFTLAEGSCDYAAYLVLKEVPGGESEYLMHAMTEDDDRFYGEALRRVIRYAEEHGNQRWLTLLKNNGRLPAY